MVAKEKEVKLFSESFPVEAMTETNKDRLSQKNPSIELIDQDKPISAKPS